MKQARLYYFHDPMCSWCWGFRPVWMQLQQELRETEPGLTINYVLGGLAPDTDQPMPEAMQQFLQSSWKKIQSEIPGTRFNFDFWQACLPRRSTYPACRAMIAARMQAPEAEMQMLLTIQTAYYLEARNPSDLDVLISLCDEISEKAGDEIGLDKNRFISDIQSEQCQQLFEAELETCHRFNVESFPTLILQYGDEDTAIQLDYRNFRPMYRSISQNLARFRQT